MPEQGALFGCLLPREGVKELPGAWEQVIALTFANGQFMIAVLRLKQKQS